MSPEPFIAFFLLRDVRRILRNTARERIWDKEITYLLYGIIGLFVSDIVCDIFFHIEIVTRWIWHLLLFAIIGIAFLKEDFKATRNIMFAVLPFAIVSLVADIVKLWNAERFKLINTSLGIASVFSIIWLIAMLVISRKQQKALLIEHQKTQQEEEQKLWMAAKKDELEKIVAERTSELRQQKEQVEATLTELKSTQTQLIQAEKMASLGELTAGIAHEIQNPLNFVNNFSDVNVELIDEMKNELNAGNNNAAVAIAENIKENQQKITHHGRRADAIVKGMLQHSRKSTGQKELTEINVLADEYLRLSYHGLRAKDKTFNATMKVDFDENIEKINLVPQDIGRVFLNLFTNAFYAVNEKRKDLQSPGNDSVSASGEQAGYEPTVVITTKAVKLPSGSKGALISVKDNGNGIASEIMDKIFQPFFTTKPTGQGTGLGLSLSYDIIKAHGGEINVETKEGAFTEFIIQLPLITNQ
ncbi:MAG: ATP-binding protein [Ginsengibacter sp.]